MLFPPLVSGRFLRRYKRFFADFELEDGQVVTAHCANPGSMKSIVDAAPHGLLSRARPGRKLEYTWELAVLTSAPSSCPTYIYVNPSGANTVVAEALRRRALPEFSRYETITAEVRLGTSSRIDFLLQGPLSSTYLEVKNVTLRLGEARGAFPDAVTERGTKHLRELMSLAQSGHGAALLFCVSRTDVNSVEPAVHIDPVYARTLVEAVAAGVSVLAYGGEITPLGFTLSRRLPVLLPGSTRCG